MAASHDASRLAVIPLPAFNDNYLWLLTRGRSAAVVDPGDAGPVRHALDRLDLTLDAILVTHHHADHVGGDAVTVLGTRFNVMDVPGHTAGHIAYFAAGEKPPRLFCGDTLFACGCGRLFEGTPAQMLTSLDSLAALPHETLVYCAHEYTLANIRFAQTVEPGNAALAERAARDAATRSRGEPTVPSSIGLEIATNPFLRCDVPAVRAAVEGSTANALDRTSVFARLREKKNVFR